MNSDNAKPTQKTNPGDPRAVDPIDLVNQELERQPTIDPEEAANNPAITPQMLDEGDNLRGDLKVEK